MKNVVLYLNQFYGGIGGEDKADYEPAITENIVGPGLALKSKLKNGQIIRTIICGDNYMATHRDEALQSIGKMLKDVDFDVLVAGPAFMAGRYGTACSEVCKYVQDTFGKMTVTCMNEENPGRDLYLSELYIIQGHDSAAKMRKDMDLLSKFVNKLLNDEEILWAEKEGYFPRGLRKQIITEKSAAERAYDMLMAKLNGEPFETEYPIIKQERIPIAPAVADTGKIKLAFISTGGVVPCGNPDRIPSASATKFGLYDLSEYDALIGGDINEPVPGQFRTVHGGYDPAYCNENPNVCVPWDALKILEKQGRIGELYPILISTTGNHTNKKDSERMANEMADIFKREQIQAAILVSF